MKFLFKKNIFAIGFTLTNLLVLFGSTTPTKAVTPTPSGLGNDAAQAASQVINCPVGDAYDASCKCEMTQCRLSKLGSADFSSGSNAAVVRAGAGSFSCFNEGDTVGLPGKNSEAMEFFRGNYVQFDPETQQRLNDGEIICPSDNYLLEFAQPSVRTDGQNDSGDPCFVFNFTMSNGVLSTGVGVIFARRVEDISDGFLNIVADPQWNKNVWNDAVSVYEKVGNEVPNLYRICTKQRFLIHFYTGYNNIVPCRDDCLPRKFFFDTPKYLADTSISLNPVPPYTVEVLPDPLKGGVCEDNIDGGGANQAISRSLPFYTDEFNRMPNAQNVPIGAKCVVKRRDVDGYKTTVSYWELPQSEYFKSIGDYSNEPCTSIFGKTDIFGRDVTTTPTAFGCLPNSFNGLVTFFVRLAVAISGAVTMLIVSINLAKMISQSSNSDAVAEARKKLVSGVLTFVGLISTLTILNILGLQILSLDAFGGGILRIFTGG